MARVDYSTPQITSPSWAGQCFCEDTLIPGGGRLDAAQFTADSKGRKPLTSGTLLGRTFTERTAGTGFGPAADTDDEIFLLAFDVTDAVYNADCELYRHTSLVKENFLPGWSGLSSALKTIVRAKYQCILGLD